MNNQIAVYILTNKLNTVLYTGVTSKFIQRIYQHKHKYVPGFTSKYNVEKLVYYEMFIDINEAIKREKQIKNLVRRKKIDLINKFNPEWKDLYAKIIK